MQNKSLKAVALACLLVASGQAHAYVFTTIIGTTTGSTFVRDVNASGVAVGFTNDPTGIHGFRWNAGAFTAVNVPQGINTQVNGINDAGVMTGFYEDLTGEHGFIGTPGSFRVFDAPGARAGRTFAYGINNLNQVAGYYQTTTGITGFIYDAGTFTNVNIPNSFGVALTSINDSGTLGGTYYSPTGQQGFTMTAGGVVTKISAPAGAVAQVNGLTNNGEFGAAYTTVATHGLTGSTTVDVPNASSTTVYGLNDIGQLVGEYTLPASSIVWYGYITNATGDVPVTPGVPEPSSVALLALGLTGLGLLRRRNGSAVPLA